MKNFRVAEAVLRGAAVVGAGLWLAGCAVQHGGNGQVQFSVDDAAIFGQVVQSFRLPDGSEARLRMLGGRYSVKLERQMRVIPVEGGATVAELHSVHSVGDRTVIVLTKSAPSCPYKNQLIALRGNEALSWDAGDCWHKPEVRATPDALALDYVQDSGGAQRFVYQDGRLQSGHLSPVQLASVRQGGQSSGAGASARQDGQGIPAQAPRYVPGLPSAAVEASLPAAAASGAAPAQDVPRAATPARAAAAARPAARAAAAAPRDMPPARPLEFQAQEQKPLRIVLDK